VKVAALDEFAKITLPDIPAVSVCEVEKTFWPPNMFEFADTQAVVARFVDVSN
jgi:hypothetical protein